jgi:hypothetical protein
MELRSDIQLRAVIKALTEVVLPAVDPTNRLATEQGHLVLGMLKLMEHQIPLQYRFDCDELRRLVALGEDLRSKDRTGTEGLLDSSNAGKEILSRAQADPVEVVRAVRHLRATISAYVGVTYSCGNTEARKNVHRSVATATFEQVRRDRAWARDQGWESDPSAVGDIEQLI